jgi:galactokinase
MNEPDLNDLVLRAAGLFGERFGRPPRWLAAAPGRVNIIGEHTDYNGGFVLPMAIERYVVLAADRAAGRLVRLWSTAAGEARFTLDGQSAPELPRWCRYVRGVLAGYQRRNMDPGPIDVLVDATVPLGGGLSSSAALEVATATLIEQITGCTLDPTERACLCQHAEHEYAGVPCGIMDQFASVFGRRDSLMLLDCRTRQIQWIPLTDPAVTVLIANTNVKHELAGDGSPYAERRAACERAARQLGVPQLRDVTAEQLEASRDRLDDVTYRRARHVVGEIGRTVAASRAIAQCDWPAVGELMYASHTSLRDDYEVSCPELDLLVETARAIGLARGVIGSRMTGGGFGGCTVSLVRSDAVFGLVRVLRERYRAVASMEPTVFTSRPARGAHAVVPETCG